MINFDLQLFAKQESENPKAFTFVNSNKYILSYEEPSEVEEGLELDDNWFSKNFPDGDSIGRLQNAKSVMKDFFNKDRLIKNARYFMCYDYYGSYKGLFNNKEDIQNIVEHMKLQKGADIRGAFSTVNSLEIFSKYNKKDKFDKEFTLDLTHMNLSDAGNLSELFSGSYFKEIILGDLVADSENMKGLLNAGVFAGKITGLEDIDLSNAVDLYGAFDSLGLNSVVYGFKKTEPDDFGQTYDIPLFINLYTGELAEGKSTSSDNNYIDKWLQDFKFNRPPKGGLLTSIGYIFGDCRVNKLDLSGWDVSNVTDMGCAFRSCGIKELDLTGWDTSKVSNFGLFIQRNVMKMTSLKGVFDLSSVNNSYECIDFSGFNLADDVKVQIKNPPEWLVNENYRSLGIPVERIEVVH